MKDERLNPNSRLIATLVSMYLDADAPARKKNGITVDESQPIDEEKAKRDKDLIEGIIRSQFVNKRGYIMRTDPDAPVEDTRPSLLDKEYEDRFKSIIAETMPVEATSEGD